MTWKNILKYIPSGKHHAYLPTDVSNSYDEIYAYFENPLLSLSRNWEDSLNELSFSQQKLAGEVRSAFQDTIFQSLKYKEDSGESHYDADKIKQDLDKIKELRTKVDEIGWGDKSINFDFHFNVLKEFMLEKLPLIRQRKEQPDPTHSEFRRLRNIN
mgnify:CR=1 FL=1